MLARAFLAWRNAGLTAPSIAALVALAILLMLGSWQISRKAWKEDLISQRAALGTKPPIDPGPALFTANTIPEYTRVTLAGRFHHDKERFWFADGREGSGFHIFAPFELADASVVWVDRGYIPARLRDPATRAQGQMPDRVTIAGAIRLPGERNRFTPDNDIAKNTWYWKDLPALQASAFPPQTRHAPIILEIDASPAPPGGWPRGGGLQTPLSNRHLEYALTWYGLAASLIGVFITFARTRLSRARQKMAPAIE